MVAVRRISLPSRLREGSGEGLFPTPFGDMPSPSPSRKREGDWSGPEARREASTPFRIARHRPKPGPLPRAARRRRSRVRPQAAADRKSVVQGKSVSVRLDLGGRRIDKNTTLGHSTPKYKQHKNQKH